MTARWEDPRTPQVVWTEADERRFQSVLQGWESPYDQELDQPVVPAPVAQSQGAAQPDWQPGERALVVLASAVAVIAWPVLIVWLAL